MCTDKNGELLLPSGSTMKLSEAETAVSSVQIRTVPYKSVLVASATLLLIDTTVYFLKRHGLLTELFLTPFISY